MAEAVATEDGTIKVRILNGAQFTSRRTRATPVGALRSALSLPSTAEISVNSITVQDDHVLQDDDIVAATLDNKNGGKLYLVPVS